MTLTLTIPNNFYFMFWVFLHITGSAETKVIKFCTLWSSDDKLPPNGRGQDYVTICFNFGPIISLELV